MAESDEETFLRFHQVASARKMDLAMRGLDVPNLAIDELYELATKQQLPEPSWDGFILDKFPSPRDESAERAASEMEAEQRRLKNIGDRIARSCHGDDDVDVGALVEVVHAFVKMLEVGSLGAFGTLTRQEALSNLHKLTAGCTAAGATGGSLLGVLRAEKRNGIHGAGGVLKDPSAAMGVLWIARFLGFWEEIVLMRAQPPPPDGSLVTLRTTIEGAYQHTLLPYHGWMTEKAFQAAVMASPEWEAVRPDFAPTEELYREDVGTFVAASQPLLKRINAALTQLDLFDTRKSV